MARILLVEDDKIQAKTTKDYLENSGYEVIWVENGKSAIKTSKTESVDLILLDVVLPDIDGNEVCRWLKSNEDTKGIPIIILSAKISTKEKVFGLEAGRLMILTLRDQQMANQLMPAFHGDLYKKLDVSLVDHIILEKLLAIDKDKEEMNLAYSYDRLEAVERVKDGQYQLAFILNPIKPDLIKAIADIGDRMPRKSTYFYPKSPAGLVFYKW